MREQRFRAALWDAGRDAEKSDLVRILRSRHMKRENIDLVPYLGMQARDARRI